MKTIINTNNSINTKGKTSENLENEGRFAFEGDWIYYNYLTNLRYTESKRMEHKKLKLNDRWGLSGGYIRKFAVKKAAIFSEGSPEKK